MIISEKHLILPKWRAPTNVRVVVTTRAGGASQGVFQNNNLSYNCGDDPKVVDKNWRTMQHSLDYDSLAILEQVHGNRVVDALSAINGSHQGDALVCSVAGIACAILTADCLPVVLTNNNGDKVAVVHCGWRGLASGILKNTVALFQQSESIHAWIGPGICQSCYQVGSLVHKVFSEHKNCFVKTGSERWLCDLSSIATEQLDRLGVKNVDNCQLCTYELDDIFYSYRRNEQTGRIATLAWLAHE